VKCPNKLDYVLVIYAFYAVPQGFLVCTFQVTKFFKQCPRQEQKAHLFCLEILTANFNVIQMSNT